MSVHTPSRAELLDKAIVEHSGSMLHYFYSRSNDWGIAQDLSQELWKSVFKKFRPEQFSQKGLFYSRAYQVWADYYRKVVRRPNLTFIDEFPEPVLMPERREPGSKEEDDELFERFWSLFDPDEYDLLSRKIFWLHERYGYTMIETAKRLGVSKSTAHDKLQRLKSKCLERLESNNQTDEDHA